MVATLTIHANHNTTPRIGGILPNLLNLDERTIATLVNNGTMLRALQGTEEQQQHAAAACRRLLTRPVDPPVQSVIDAELLPCFVRLLATSSNQEVRVNAAWVITNIAAGSRAQTLEVFDSGALPVLVSLLNTNQGLLLLSLVALAVANITRDVRDDVLNSGAIEPVLLLLDHHLDSNDEICKDGSPYCELLDLLCQLCRGTPRPPLDRVERALPLLVRIGQKSRNEVVLVHVCWALESFFVEGHGGEYYSAMHRRSVRSAIDAGALPVLVDLAIYSVSADVASVTAGSLNALLGLSSISTSHAQELVSAGCLVALRKCIRYRVAHTLVCDILVNLINHGFLSEIIEKRIIPVLFDLIHNTHCQRLIGRVGCVIWNACQAADFGVCLVLLWNIHNFPR